MPIINLFYRRHTLDKDPLVSRIFGSERSALDRQIADSERYLAGLLSGYNGQEFDKISQFAVRGFAQAAMRELGDDRKVER